MICKGFKHLRNRDKARCRVTGNCVQSPIFVDFPGQWDAPRGLLEWMSDPMLEKNAARLVDVRILEAFDVLGPTIQFLSADEGKNDPSVVRGIIAPGVVVPLHSLENSDGFRSGRAMSFTYPAGPSTPFAINRANRPISSSPHRPRSAGSFGKSSRRLRPGRSDWGRLRRRPFSTSWRRPNDLAIAMPRWKKMPRWEFS